MNIVFLAIGSRGDLQPYIALALELKKLNDTVIIATHAIYKDLVESYGINFSLISGDPNEIIASKEMEDFLTTANPFRMVKKFSDMQLSVAVKALDDCWAACQKANIILYSALATNIAASIGEKLSIPSIPAYCQPYHPTSDFPSVWLKKIRDFGKTGNLITWHAVELLQWYFARKVVNDWRVQKLNLPPIPQKLFYWRELRKKEQLALYAFSSAVIQKPNDWTAREKITGYWYLKQPIDWQPPRALVDFLASGPAPLYIGFGSYNSASSTIVDTYNLVAIIQKSLEKTGQRAILGGVWPDLVLLKVPTQMMMPVASIPHDWLFPQMSAIIHHGSAGTLSAALLAGKPSIIIPLTLDQPFWGERASLLGIGSKPIPFMKLTVQNLSNAIVEVTTNKLFLERAKTLQTEIINERGAEVAAQAIHNVKGAFYAE